MKLKRYQIICILALLPLLGFIFMLNYGYGYIVNVTRPATKLGCCLLPEEWEEIGEVVEFQSESDGITLSGWYFSPQNQTVIILLHGYGSNRRSTISIIQMLLGDGYGVLAYDMRGHGESDGEQRALGWFDIPDVEGAVKFLADHPEVEHIGIWGHSMGGSVAARATAQIPQIEVLVVDGGSFAFAADVQTNDLKTPWDWGGYYYRSAIFEVMARFWLNAAIPASVTESIDEVSPRPILFIGGMDDPNEVILLENFYEAASEPKQIFWVDGAVHGNTWKVAPDDYQRELLTFLEEAFSAE